MLVGCATPAPSVTQTKWGSVLEHPDDVSGCNFVGSSGCYIFITGHEIWYFGMRARTHEMAHVAGMRHGTWQFYRDWNCAIITEAGDTAYRKGDRICIAANGNEWIN